MARGWTDGQILRARRQGLITTVLPGTYVPAGTPHESKDVLFAAATAHYGPGTTAALGTAARIHGLPEPWPEDGAVHIALPPGSEQARAPGLAIHTWILRGHEVETVSDARVTTVERTLVDLMCLTDRLSAVSAVDAALNLGLVTPAQVSRLSRTTVRRRGAARSRTWWALADGRSESPLETRIRLRAIDGGYRPHELQKVIEVDGRTYRADLAWRQPNGRLLVAEADGRSAHDQPAALFADRRRSNDLVGTGEVDILRFTWGDSTRPTAVPLALSRFLGPPVR